LTKEQGSTHEAYERTVDKWLDEIKKEYYRASEKYGSFNSTHEAYGVIKEEFDELWDLMKLKPESGRWNRMRYEAIQLATMALRFLVDFELMVDE